MRARSAQKRALENVNMEKSHLAPRRNSGRQAIGPDRSLASIKQTHAAPGAKGRETLLMDSLRPYCSSSLSGCSSLGVQQPVNEQQPVSEQQRVGEQQPVSVQQPAHLVGALYTKP